MIRNKEGDVHICKNGKVLRALPAKESAVPVRRGTGPKARLQAFLLAFDKWFDMYSSKDGDDMTFDELCELQARYDVMMEARKGITTKLGLGD